MLLDEECVVVFLGDVVEGVGRVEEQVTVFRGDDVVVIICFCSVYDDEFVSVLAGGIGHMFAVGAENRWREDAVVLFALFPIGDNKSFYALFGGISEMFSIGAKDRALKKYVIVFRLFHRVDDGECFSA